MAINRVDYGGTTLIDITDTTLTAERAPAGYYFHAVDGTKTQGTLTVNPGLSTSTTASTFTVYAPKGVYTAQTGYQFNLSTALPVATKGTVSNHSVSVTPSYTPNGNYVQSGAKTGTAVTVSASELESGTKSITANGTGIDVTGYSAVDVAVPGGGSSMNVQIDNTTHRIGTTTYTDTGAYLKVAVAGKYSIYWSAFRSSTSSGTSGTLCYVNSNTQGSAFTSWTNSYAQVPALTGVTLAKNDEIRVYARSSSNSRYVCVSNLTIIQTA